MSDKKKLGVACIIWYKDDKGVVRVLMGVESRYLSDLDLYKTKGVNVAQLRLRMDPAAFHGLELGSKAVKPDGTLKTFVTMQEFESVSAMPELQAKAIFSKRASALRNLTNCRVQFDTPNPTVDHGFSVNFRIIMTEGRIPSTFGIIKGRMEETDKGNAKSAIAREISEEAGTRLGQHIVDAMKCIGHAGRDQCFELELTRKDVETWKTNFVERFQKKHGELLDLAFVPCFDQTMELLPDIRPIASIAAEQVSQLVKMNGKTLEALKLFQTRCSGGGAVAVACRVDPICVPSHAPSHVPSHASSHVRGPSRWDVMPAHLVPHPIQQIHPPMILPIAPPRTYSSNYVSENNKRRKTQGGKHRKASSMRRRRRTMKKHKQRK